MVPLVQNRSDREPGRSRLEAPASYALLLSFTFRFLFHDRPPEWCISKAAFIFWDTFKSFVVLRWLPSMKAKSNKLSSVLLIKEWPQTCLQLVIFYKPPQPPLPIRTSSTSHRLLQQLHRWPLRSFWCRASPAFRWKAACLPSCCL